MQGMGMTKTITATLAVMVVAPQKKIMAKRKKNPLVLRAAPVVTTAKKREATPDTARLSPLPLKVPVAVPAAAAAAAVQAAAVRNPADPRRSPAEAKAAPKREALRKAAPRRAAPKKAVLRKVAPRRVALRKADPKKAAARRADPKKVAAKKVALKKVAVKADQRRVAVAAKSQFNHKAAEPSAAFVF